MTPTEQAGATTRAFDGVDKAEIFDAAEKLFYLDDGNDFQFSRSPDVLVASRSWIMSTMFGADNWRISTAEQDGTLRVKVDTTVDARQFFPVTGAAASPAALVEPAGDPVEGPALFELFWARMDYLMGRSTHWTTCEEMDARIAAGSTWGNTIPLCGPTTKDTPPAAGAL